MRRATRSMMGSLSPWGASGLMWEREGRIREEAELKPEEGQHRTGFQAKARSCVGAESGRQSLGWGGVFVGSGDNHGRGGLSPGRQEMVRGGQRIPGQERRHTWGGRAGSGVWGKAWKGGLGHITNATPGVCISRRTMEGLYVGMI